jgi:hypothetical protein
VKEIERREARHSTLSDELIEHPLERESIENRLLGDDERSSGVDGHGLHCLGRRPDIGTRGRSTSGARSQRNAGGGD